MASAPQEGAAAQDVFALAASAYAPRAPSAGAAAPTLSACPPQEVSGADPRCVSRAQRGAHARARGRGARTH